ncbi:hypothetical protein [Cohnella thailandensis]|uniref:Uncharacterized protein n=1 Tax=Cohnella thailandensis TaxID=557557 RepID=A0A841SP09_9BACL|nr:hypothetical protein [Cohnella thailandensis]MBB6632922.1 hypothetical protein [Cohnella thailandensis]MBP1975385.1 hypothetical protein [Cohnella thailandensis]
MRNPISTWLMGIGILLIAIGFVLGLVSAGFAYGEFSFLIVLYWWLGGVVSGFIFIGMSEIVHLLQKIHDQNGGMNASGGTAAATPIAPSLSGEATTNTDKTEGTEEKETPFKDLTIVVNGERFKGQLRITKSTVKIMRKSMFDSEAQLVKAIPKSLLSTEYERDDDYIVYRFQEGSSYQKLAFKTYNVYDYEKIVNLLSDRR